MADSQYVAAAAAKLYKEKHGVDFCGIAADGVAIDQSGSDREMPVKAEIDAEAKILEDAGIAKAYQAKRGLDYPNVRVQMDMIYHDMKNGTTTHADAVEAVKTKWPKDNSGPVE